MRNPRFLLTIVLATNLLGGVAIADDKEAARREYMEGTRRYDLNEFGPALEAFKRAYLAYEDPAFLYNIAQCYRQLGDKQNALKFYRSYLRKVPDAPNRNEVTATMATLEAAIAAEKANAAAARPAIPQSPPPSLSPSTTPAANTLVQSVPSQRHTPVYKKWWLWTIVGVAATGAATGIALAVTSQRTEGALMPVTVTQ